ncbi:Bicarbonate transport ATP-binding protein CmpC [Trichinella spiralis]|uniref:Bicarbonate transport ATP-binding protein CmpC n=1 Tax=Trichinella spiralis TaxID=6334 RepID=A0ABR3KCQ5_TRISP
MIESVQLFFNSRLQQNTFFIDVELTGRLPTMLIRRHCRYNYFFDQCRILALNYAINYSLKTPLGLFKAMRNLT